ncbi:MAG: hypothetical protein ABEJ04_06635 [Halobacteriaceae archaeon]
MDPRWWTPFVFLAPGRYVDRSDFWADFDFDSWSESTYEWTSDEWHGYRDVATPPAETVATGRGDCEDYALVAASWALARERGDVGLGFCWESPYPWARHVVAYDDERVYSSGSVTRESVAEWLDGSRYVYCLRRPVE